MLGRKSSSFFSWRLHSVCNLHWKLGEHVDLEIGSEHFGGIRSMELSYFVYFQFPVKKDEFLSNVGVCVS